MEVSAWAYVGALEDDRIVERLLSSSENELHYEMDPPSRPAPGATILHMSCNTLSIPHIAYLIQEVLRAMKVDFIAMGGPENCCGAPQWASGDDKLANQAASLTLGGFRRAKPVRVVSTCPDCDILFQLYMQRQHTFRQSNILELLVENIEALTPLLKNPVKKRVIIHYHDENDGRKADTRAMFEVLRRIPALEIVEASHAGGFGNHCLVKTGRLDNTLFEPAIQNMFREAVDLRADTLVVPYHGCYRQHCKRQLQYGVEVFHYISLIAESIGIKYEEKFKTLRMLDNLDAAVAQVRDIGVRHGYTESAIRHALVSKVYV